VIVKFTAGLRQPMPIVFEMIGPTLVVPPGESSKLIISGPDDAVLEIGHGENGFSLFRGLGLEVEAFDNEGSRIDTTGFR
jgi:hypothetical protein